MPTLTDIAPQLLDTARSQVENWHTTRFWPTDSGLQVALVRIGDPQQHKVCLHLLNPDSYVDTDTLAAARTAFGIPNNVPFQHTLVSRPLPGELFQTRAWWTLPVQQPEQLDLKTPYAG